MGKAGGEKKRRKKKKGRPSLLDLQKRSLKQQQQQNRDPLTTTDPHKRGADGRDVLPNPNSRRTAGNSSDGEDGRRRREKKLKLVLKLPPIGRPRQSDGSEGLDSSGSEEDGGGMRTRFKKKKKKRKIDAVAAVAAGSDDADAVADADADADASSGDDKKGRRISLPEATEGKPPSPETATTPLPDKKLLVFILDRLQKKDTYGVYAEPVEPDELPDYHDIIEHPMDFSTIRKKLASGAYATLEQFEDDVFLLSSNAMRYNSPDTIYFRQARSIQELAKKDFCNLRQESDDNESEPKIVRRGRPPNKNTIKKTVGRPPSLHSSLNVSSNATIANASVKTFTSNSSRDLHRKGLTDEPGIIDSSARPSYIPRNSLLSWNGEKKYERSEEYSGLSARYGKKLVVSDENRRNTCKQYPLTSLGPESSILTTFDGERRELLPVSLYMEHSYARSLARFAANLGPAGWELAARQIERVLQPGIKYGRGWVGEKDLPQPRLLSTKSCLSRPQSPLLPIKTLLPQQHQPSPLSINSSASPRPVPERLQSSSKTLASDGSQPITSVPSSSSAPAIENIHDTVEIAESPTAPNCSSNFTQPINPSKPKAPFQLHQNSLVQPKSNSLNAGFTNTLSQVGKISKTFGPSGSCSSSDATVSHARALEIVSRSNSNLIYPSTSSHFIVENTKIDDRSMIGTKNDFFHPTVANQVDAEQLNSNSSNKADSLRSTEIELLQAQKTKLSRPGTNTIDTENSRFIHPAGQTDKDKARLNNANTVNFGNKFSNNPEVTVQSDSQKIIHGNPTIINYSTNFTNRPATSTGRSELVMQKFGSPRMMSGTLNSSQNSQGFYHNISSNPRPDSAPPDLNVRFQSPGSPSTNVVVVDSQQQPDLALQL